MARPPKQGVDYFPLDVYLDDKCKFIEIKYKLEGFAIMVKLLQKVYANSYWCKWTEDELLLFSDELRVDHDLVQNVVRECLNRDIFHIGLFQQYGILTSKGIQKRYKEIVRRRKDVEVTTEYLLVDGNFGINDGINSKDDGTMSAEGSHDDGKSTQRKGKESKVIKPSRHKYETCDMEMAELLFSKMLENNPATKEQSLEKWANESRLMREIDKRTIEQIRYLIEWTQNDDFWKTNILSMGKLRKQYDQLVLKIKTEREKKKAQPEQTNMAGKILTFEDFD